MKKRMFENKIFTASILGAAGAIALCAQQAFALGGMGGAVGAHAGGMNAGMIGSVGSHVGASGMAGSVTMNGITVLPNGSLSVPAVTPRVPTGPSSSLNRTDDQMTGAPCRTAASCDGY
jgi:hypothetical protein